MGVQRAVWAHQTGMGSGQLPSTVKHLANGAHALYFGADGFDHLHTQVRRGVGAALRHFGVHGAAQGRVEQGGKPAAVHTAHGVEMGLARGALKHGQAIADFDQDEVHGATNGRGMQFTRHHALHELQACARQHLAHRGDAHGQLPCTNSFFFSDPSGECVLRCGHRVFLGRLFQRPVNCGVRRSANAARQEWCRALCAATHDKPDALAAALLMVEIFASGLELRDWDIDMALEAARKTVVGVPSEFESQLDTAKEFESPASGVSLNPLETLLSVMSVVRKSETVWDAYENSICLGGDTDTVAALSGALVALRNPLSFYELDFIRDVNWQEIPQITAAIELLFANRAGK